VRPTFAGERASEIRASNWVLTNPDVVRAVFPFMAPPSAGQFLMFALISGIWLHRERAAANTAGKAAGTVLLLIVAAGLLATLSRQSFLGAGAGVLALAIGRRPGRAVAMFVTLVLIVAVVPIPGSSQSFGNYLLSASDTSTASTSTRLELWQQTIDLVPAHALIGAGPGLVGTLGPGASKRPFYAHNIFLDAAVELGIFGALALLAMFLAGLGAAYRRRASLSFSLLVAYLVAGLFDDVLYTPRNGLLLALAFALIADRRSAGSPTRPVPSS
jgi:O-antigen ligase